MDIDQINHEMIKQFISQIKSLWFIRLGEIWSSHRLTFIKEPQIWFSMCWCLTSLLLKSLQPEGPLIKIQTRVWDSHSLNGPRRCEEMMVASWVCLCWQRRNGRVGAEKGRKNRVCDESDLTCLFGPHSCLFMHALSLCFCLCCLKTYVRLYY